MEGYTKVEATYQKSEKILYPVQNDKYIRVSSWEYRNEMISAARKGQLNVVSDVSFMRTKNNKVAAAWIMETVDQKITWKGSGLMFTLKN